MAVLDERKVRCLLNWLNVEAGSTFRPVHALEELSSFDQICWLIGHVSAHDGLGSCNTAKGRGKAVVDFLYRSYDAAVVDSLCFDGGGMLSNDRLNLGTILALLLNYALRMAEHNEKHVALVQQKMEVSDQYSVMEICKTLAERPDTRWSLAVDSAPSQERGANSNESCGNDALNVTAPSSIEDTSNANTSYSPASPSRRINKSLSGYRRFRNSVRRKWELMRNTERQLAEKNGEIDVLTMEMEHLKAQLREKDAKEKELQSLLVAERRSRQDCEQRLEQTKAERQEFAANSEKMTAQYNSLSSKFDVLVFQMQKQQSELDALSAESETLRSQLSVQRSSAKGWHDKFVEFEENMLTNKRELEHIIKEQVDRIGLLQMEKRQLSDKLDEEAALYEISKNKSSDQKKLIKNLLVKFRTLKDCAEKMNAKLKTCETCLAECMSAKEQSKLLASKLEFCLCVMKDQKLRNEYLMAEISRLKDAGNVHQLLTSTPRHVNGLLKEAVALPSSDEEVRDNRNGISGSKQSLETDLSNINNPEIMDLDLHTNRENLSNTSAKVQEILKNSINSQSKYERSLSSDTFASADCDGKTMLRSDEAIQTLRQLGNQLKLNDASAHDEDYILSSLPMSDKRRRLICFNPAGNALSHVVLNSDNDVTEEAVFKRPATPRAKVENKADHTLSSVEQTSVSTTSTSSGTPSWCKWNRRLSLLNQRNRRYPPHLKSSYPIETQGIIDTDLEEELKQPNGLQSASVLRVMDRLEMSTDEKKKKKPDKSAMRKALLSAKKVISNRLSKTQSPAVSMEEKTRRQPTAFFIGNTPRKVKNQRNKTLNIPA